MRPPRTTTTLVHVLTDIPEQWEGWRFEGAMLRSPDGQKINARRLTGLLWRESKELRRAGFASRAAAERDTRSKQYQPRIKVVLIELADYRLNGIAAA